jgi:RNA polymerase sigma factor (sigma-70 family)
MIIPGLILALELSDQHDEELARRLQRKEPQAMADLYDRFGRLAYSVLFVDMERDVLNRDHARIIKKALAKLNNNQQKVITLAYYEGLSQTEMAERLGQPLGTVKTWVRGALKLLREELGQEVTP